MKKKLYIDRATFVNWWFLGFDKIFKDYVIEGLIKNGEMNFNIDEMFNNCVHIPYYLVGNKEALHRGCNEDDIVDLERYELCLG